jgi:two-component system heavy metal sensor histidine kinase CusS
MPPELAEMAHSFNAMLGRLDDAFQRLSAFSADIAHELRTPLSNLLTHTQVTLTRPRRSRITAKRCTATSKNCNGWRSWSTTCLYLAKADHGLLMPKREALELADEADVLLEFFAPLAEDAG